MIESVAVLAPLVQKFPLFMGEDQFFGTALRRKTLRGAVKYLFIVFDHDDIRCVEFLDYFESMRMVQNFFLDIKMREKLRL